MNRSTAPSKDNNFNLIRMVAALLVLISHSYALSTGSGDNEPLRLSLGTTWGSIAVDIFFVTSGYLVTASLLSRGDVLGFVIARVLRILPGLIVAISATVVICGLFFTSRTLPDYFLDAQTWRYLVKNIVMFRGTEWNLPGVFENTPTAVQGVHGGAVNGSLWTLFLEVKMYACLAVIYCISRWWARRSGFHLEDVTASKFLTWFGTACLAYNLVANIDQREHQVSGLLSMFFVGAALFCQRARIPMRWSLLLLAAASLVAAALFGTPRLFGVVYVLTLPYIVLAVALVPGGLIRQFNLLGDYSYGTYVYAFPIQQMVADLLSSVSPWGMTALATPVVLLIAAASWYWVEEPILHRKQALTESVRQSFRRV